jgi:hypothetical protein
VTIPSTTEPVDLWMRKLPKDAVGYPRAHLEPTCHALTTRIGEPVPVRASHLFDHSYTRPPTGHPHWAWAVRVEGGSPPYREHLDVYLCAHCLDRAVAARLVPFPPPLRVVHPHLFEVQVTGTRA